MTRTITITPVLNGFRVKVGCQEVVYTEAAALAHDFIAYVKDPDAFEKTVLSAALNRDLLKNPAPEGCPPPRTASECQQPLGRLSDAIFASPDGINPTPQQERR